MLPGKRDIAFFLGLFLSASSVLSLQILITRLLSNMLWYSIAFFAISVAMLGMTIGALIVYFFRSHFSSNILGTRLSFYSILFALLIVVSCVLLITTLPFIEFSALVMTAIIFIKLTLVLSPPFVFGGIVITLALTRSPYKVGFVYAVDLLGAASGCFFILLVMSVMDGVSAILMVGALAGSAALLFLLYSVDDVSRAQPRRLKQYALVTVCIGLLALGNAAIHPYGGRILFNKDRSIGLSSLEAIHWNSFSTVSIGKPAVENPFLWGPAPNMPAEAVQGLEQRWMKIDGDAGTGLFKYSGDRDELSFLQYDITNLAYSIRNNGSAAIIGVGGGRDVLSAYYFGFEEIVGVEINGIFVDNLTERYRDFNRLVDIDGVQLVVDEARSWFARSDRRFDLVQMSLIDTWAATGVGAFSLTENGLYTIESWSHFLSRLTPNGVFTVSRWYSPDNPGETGRLVSLAKAALFRMGADDPNRHIFLAATDRLATIIVTPSPLSQADVINLRRVSDNLGFTVLMDSDSAFDSPAIRSVYAAQSEADLRNIALRSPLDFSPPSDDRPFFFNQLRPGAAIELLISGVPTAGVLNGNITATAILLLIILVSLLAVMATVIIPTLPSVSRVGPALVRLGTSYFALIGLGFMFAEIGFIQRLSIFLGHPVYGLAIALAGVIVATGAGAALSGLWPLRSRNRLFAWAGLTCVCLGSMPFWLPSITAAFASADIVGRVAVSLAAIAPTGILLGFGFPTGMRLVNAIDPQPTPWFWAVNGAAGVLASGLAVAVSVFVSINATLWAAAICYLLLLPVGLSLLKRARPATS